MKIFENMFSLCLTEIKEAWDCRRLSWFNATQRSNVRFARTKLGSLWLGISSILSTAILALVYSRIFKADNFNVYIVQLGLGLSLWNCIAAPIGSAPSLFEKNSSQISNMNTPHVYYLIEEWAFNIQTFFQSFLIVILFLTLFQGEIIQNIIWPFLPTMFNYLLVMFWLPGIICLLGLWLKDIYQLIPVILQVLFLLTPILYKKSDLGNASIVADLNIIFQYMSPVREALIYGELDYVNFLTLFGINISGIFVLLNILRKNKKNLPFLI